MSNQIFLFQIVKDNDPCDRSHSIDTERRIWNTHQLHDIFKGTFLFILRKCKALAIIHIKISYLLKRLYDLIIIVKLYVSTTDVCTRKLKDQELSLIHI